MLSRSIAEAREASASGDSVLSPLAWTRALRGAPALSPVRDEGHDYASDVGPDDGIDGRSVAAAKTEEMHEKRVELVELASLTMAGFKGSQRLVVRDETGRKAAEEIDHGKVHFVVAEVDGRVDKYRDAILSHDVSAPEIPVKQGRRDDGGQGTFEGAQCGTEAPVKGSIAKPCIPQSGSYRFDPPGRKKLKP